jgi:hypothetical protein
MCAPTCPADALSSSSTPDLSSAAESAKDAASDLKAKSVLKGNSALFNSSATVADLNADVRGTSESYRDPAIDPIQDKIQDKVSGEGTMGGFTGAICKCLLLRGCLLGCRCTNPPTVDWQAQGLSAP